MVLTVFKCTCQVKGSEKTGSNYINEKNKKLNIDRQNLIFNMCNN